MSWIMTTPIFPVYKFKFQFAIAIGHCHSVRSGLISSSDVGPPLLNQIYLPDVADVPFNWTIAVAVLGIELVDRIFIEVARSELIDCGT